MRCERCDAGVPDGIVLCRACRGVLSELLAEAPELARQLGIVKTRQHRYLRGSKGRSGVHPPMPLHVGAADALDGLVAALRRFGRSDPQSHAQAVGEVTRAALVLRREHRDVCREDGVGSRLIRLSEAVTAAEREVVPPAPSWYAGPCEQCGDDLLADTDGRGQPVGAEVACGRCGASYPLAGRREWLLQQAADVLVSGSVALSWVYALVGVTIPRGTWDSWVARDRLAARTVDMRTGRPLFRFGDVHALAVSWLARPRRRAAA